MDDVTPQQDDVVDQTEAAAESAALADMVAGYNKTARAEEAPAEVETGDVEQQAEVEIPAEPAAPEPTAADELKAQLNDLRAQVKALASTSDPDTVRRMHGEIGEINRTLKQLVPEPAPVKDELTAALEAAEASAEEYPEIAGPLVKALKASLAARQAQQPVQQQPANITADVATEVERRLEALAIESLAEEHPDFMEISVSPQFDKWVKSKTPALQDRIRNTENPAVAAKFMSEYKESLKVRQKKQERLENAVPVQGTPQKSGASTLPDEQGLWAGYNKGPKRFNSR